MDRNRQPRNRVVVHTPPSHQGARYSSQPNGGGKAELTVAVSVIAAAALATFAALFLTSRPYDPMNSTAEPQQTIPQGPVLVQPSPKQSPTSTPSPQTFPSPTPRASEPVGQTTAPASTDDASIQSQIEKFLAADPALSQLDVSTLVENGKVTLVGSVRSADYKQRVERLVRSVKGVLSVDNQLVITEATPQ